MGEAKRRREHALAHAAEQPARTPWVDDGEDGDDRTDRLAHGFTLDDNWQDPTVLCRNGCGLPYGEVVAGKIRDCSAATEPLVWLQAKLDSGEGDARIRASWVQRIATIRAMDQLVTKAPQVEAASG